MNENTDRIALLPLYTPTHGLARVAGAAFIVTAAVSWTAAGYDLGEVRSYAEIQHGAALEPARHIAREKTGELLRVLQVASALLVAVAFLPWLHQMRCNLRSFGLRRMRYGREWTYLGFLIPGLNLYVPHRVVSEVWRGSVSEDADPVSWQHLDTPRLVTGWWCALVGWVAVELFSSVLLHLATGVTRIQLAHALGLGADACAALSASLAYLMVVRMQAAQERKAIRLGADDAGSPILEGGVTA